MEWRDEGARQCHNGMAPGHEQHSGRVSRGAMAVPWCYLTQVFADVVRALLQAKLQVLQVAVERTRRLL